MASTGAALAPAYGSASGEYDASRATGVVTTAPAPRYRTYPATRVPPPPPPPSLYADPSPAPRTTVIPARRPGTVVTRAPVRRSPVVTRQPVPAPRRYVPKRSGFGTAFPKSSCKT